MLGSVGGFLTDPESAAGGSGKRVKPSGTGPFTRANETQVLAMKGGKKDRLREERGKKGGTDEERSQRVGEAEKKTMLRRREKRNTGRELSKFSKDGNK